MIKVFAIETVWGIDTFDQSLMANWSVFIEDHQTVSGWFSTLIRGPKSAVTWRIMGGR
jgi:hypothetical protein